MPGVLPDSEIEALRQQREDGLAALEKDSTLEARVHHL